MRSAPGVAVTQPRGRRVFRSLWALASRGAAGYAGFRSSETTQMHYISNMQCFSALMLCSFLLGCGKADQQAPKQRLQLAMSRLASADTPEKRFYALGAAAKESFVAGRIEDAEKYAQELMALLPSFQANREFGGALSDANLVLGRVALRRGNLEEAKRYLLAAGQCPATPQLENYGPNMGLAKDLLTKGERQVVLDYFELCRKFWLNGGAQLDQWSQQVRDGKTPDFTANLNN